MNNTIKFLDAYSKDDFEIFFGRDKETHELFNLVRKTNLLLLYGLSGTGKTSLVRCGLANLFGKDDWLEIYIRRGHNIIQSLDDGIQEKAVNYISSTKSLPEALESVYLDHFKPIYLIFDQFEELFISGSTEEITQFKEFLSDIVKGKARNVKVLLILREEYNACLDSFEGDIPSIFSHKLRLERMTYQTLQDVILKMIRHGNIELENDKLVDKILSNIKEDGIIELPYLQVYMDKLVRDANKLSEDKTIITEDLVRTTGELGDILGTFLEDQIRSISRSYQTQNNIYKLLKLLITPEGTKRTVNRSELKEKLELDEFDKYIKELEDGRILKIKNDIIELTHDSLAHKIATTRSDEENRIIECQRDIQNKYIASVGQTEKDYLTESQINNITKVYSKLHLTSELKEFLLESKEFIKDRKKKARRKDQIISLTTTSTIVILILGLIILGLFFKKTKKANEIIAQQRDSAQIARTEAYEAKIIAELERDTAQIALKKADSATKTAVNAKIKADYATIEAEKATLVAENERDKANKEKDKADSATKKAIDAETKTKYLLIKDKIASLSYQSEVEEKTEDKLKYALEASRIQDSLNPGRWSPTVTQALIKSMRNHTMLEYPGVSARVIDIYTIDNKIILFTDSESIIIHTNKPLAAKDKSDSTLKINDFYYKKNSVHSPTSGIIEFYDINNTYYKLDINSLDLVKDSKKAPDKSIRFGDIILHKSKDIYTLDCPKKNKQISIKLESNRVISNVVLSPDKSYIAIGTIDGWIYMYNNKGELLFSQELLTTHSPISDISFNSTEEFIAISGFDGTLIINQIDNLAHERGIVLSFDQWVHCHAFFEEKTLLLATQNKGVYALTIDTCELTDRIKKALYKEY